MRIAVLIYEGFTMLDMVGPVEVLSLLPDVEIALVAPQAGLVWPDNQAVPFVAPFGIADIDAADILLVAGGTGTVQWLGDAPLIDWIAGISAGARWTASVCTGALLLAKAGLLGGKPATTHWAATAMLRDLGAVPTAQRWVEAGTVITAAGVSAGIDMALALAARLAGEPAARAVQLGIEYDPQPPFDSGNAATAAPEVVAAASDGSMWGRMARSRPVLPPL